MDGGMEGWWGWREKEGWEIWSKEEDKKYRWWEWKAETVPKKEPQCNISEGEDYRSGNVDEAAQLPLLLNWSVALKPPLTLQPQRLKHTHKDKVCIDVSRKTITDPHPAATDWDYERGTGTLSSSAVTQGQKGFIKWGLIVETLRLSVISILYLQVSVATRRSDRHETLNDSQVRYS